MNKTKNNNSDDSESDEDYRLEDEESACESECSTEESEASNNENEDQDCESGRTKRTKANSKGRKKKSLNSHPNNENEKVTKNKRICTRQREENSNEESTKQNEEKDVLESDDEDKSRKEALWADFLKDVKPAAACKTSTVQAKNGEQMKTAEKKSSEIKDENVEKINGNKNTSKEQLSSTVAKSSKDTKIIVTEVKEFAGEEVLIEKEIDTKSAKQSNATVSARGESYAKTISTAGVKRLASSHGSSSSGGLGSILNQIGKKKKLSVLEKTKLDWNSFKHNEGIEEELQNFNRGKDGYLERQDFLQRTDLRQFEIEKNLRHSRRNH